MRLGMQHVRWWLVGNGAMWLIVWVGSVVYLGVTGQLSVITPVDALTLFAFTFVLPAAVGAVLAITAPRIGRVAEAIA